MGGEREEGERVRRTWKKRKEVGMIEGECSSKEGNKVEGRREGGGWEGMGGIVNNSCSQGLSKENNRGSHSNCCWR